jgi:hypothetical protein
MADRDRHRDQGNEWNLIDTSLGSTRRGAERGLWRIDNLSLWFHTVTPVAIVAAVALTLWITRDLDSLIPVSIVVSAAVFLGAVGLIVAAIRGRQRS